MIPFKDPSLRITDVELREKRINFNYQLSKARVRVEQLFGLLKRKWRFLNREMDVSIERHVKITTSIAKTPLLVTIFHLKI